MVKYLKLMQEDLKNLKELEMMDVFSLGIP